MPTSYSLTVLTSTACNLGCGYCFQNTGLDPRGGFMPERIDRRRLSSATIDRILDFTAARMARAGTMEALDADFTRTATLKGLRRRDVMMRHVLRNGLLPTIAVISTQVGYLFGGIVAIEKLFGYPGIGYAIDRLEHHGMSFIVALNDFGGPPHSVEQVRNALSLSPDVPIIECDARERASSKKVLITLVNHLYALSTAREAVS